MTDGVHGVAGVLDGRYRLTALLGRGGMGEVWRAHDTRIGREVAVKIVTAGGLSDEALARFDREARIAGQFSGPSIVTVHDYGHDEYRGETVPYLVMELVAGRTVADRVRTDGPPAPRTALEWALPVCEALAIAHAANVVHRDIKPSNVMVTDSGALKVLDFGIARFMEHQQTRTGLTAAGMVIGSAEYMAPEQAQGHRVDARTDLYSVGCLLFFTLTGRAPFEAESPVALAYQHVNKEAEPPSRYRVGIPAGADELVLELLAKDPEARPGSAQAVAERIRRILAENLPGQAGGSAAQPGGTSGQAAGPAGSSAAGQAAGAARPRTAGQAGSSTSNQSPGGGAGGQAAGPAVGGLAAAGAAAAASARGESPTTPYGSPTGPQPAAAERNTDLWIPGGDTQVTQVRQYPGDSSSSQQPSQGLQGPPPQSFQGPPPQNFQGPPQGFQGPPPQNFQGHPQAPDRPQSHSRRWFLAGAAAVAAGGAGVGTWLAVGRGSSENNSSSSGSSQIAGSASGSSTSSVSTTPSSSASVSAGSAAAPHNPTYLTTLNGHTDHVVHVAFRSDSRLLASCSFDGTARLWDVSDPATAKPLGVCRKHTDQVWNLAISPDGHTLATSSYDHTVQLWDIRDPNSPQPTTQIRLGNRLNGVAFSPNGEWLAVGTQDNTVKLIDLGRPTDAAGQYTLSGHGGVVYSVAFNKDGTVLASGSFDKTVRLWDVRDPASGTPQLASSTAHKDRVFDLAFQPGGPLLAVGSSDSSLILLDVSDPAKPTVTATIGETDEATGVAFSPDGHTVANGCGGSAQVRLFDVTTPSSPKPLDPLNGHTKYTYGVAVSADGKLLASASEDHTVRLWRF